MGERRAARLRIRTPPEGLEAPAHHHARLLDGPLLVGAATIRPDSERSAGDGAVEVLHPIRIATAGRSAAARLDVRLDAALA